MAKKKTARKSTKKSKKKAARPAKKKATQPRKAARSKRAAPKRKPSRGKTSGTGVVLEVAEVEVIGEPEDVASDEVFPPDYGGSE
jgi:hypothetical protein